MTGRSGTTLRHGIPAKGSWTKPLRLRWLVAGADLRLGQFMWEL